MDGRDCDWNNFGKWCEKNGKKRKEVKKGNKFLRKDDYGNWSSDYRWIDKRKRGNRGRIRNNFRNWGGGRSGD